MEKSAAILIALSDAESEKLCRLKSVLSKLRKQTIPLFCCAGSVISETESQKKMMEIDGLDFFHPMRGEKCLHQREAIWNALAHRVGGRAKFLFFIEEDTFPLNPDWAERTLLQLRRFDVVQGFSHIYDMIDRESGDPTHLENLTEKDLSDHRRLPSALFWGKNYRGHIKCEPSACFAMSVETWRGLNGLPWHDGIAGTNPVREYLQFTHAQTVTAPKYYGRTPYFPGRAESHQIHRPLRMGFVPRPLVRFKRNKKFVITDRVFSAIENRFCAMSDLCLNETGGIDFTKEGRRLLPTLEVSSKKRGSVSFSIQRISVGDLVDFLKDFLSRAGPSELVPLSLLRAASQMKNPNATHDECGLLVAFYKARCVAFASLLPGDVAVGEEKRHVAFMSSAFILHEAKETRLHYRMVEAALDMNTHLMCAQEDPLARRLWIKLPGVFSLTPLNLFLYENVMEVTAKQDPYVFERVFVAPDFVSPGLRREIDWILQNPWIPRSSERSIFHFDLFYEFAEPKGFQVYEDGVPLGYLQTLESRRAGCQFSILKLVYAHMPGHEDKLPYILRSLMNQLGIVQLVTEMKLDGGTSGFELRKSTQRENLICLAGSKLDVDSFEAWKSYRPNVRDGENSFL